MPELLRRSIRVIWTLLVGFGSHQTILEECDKPQCGVRQTAERCPNLLMALLRSIHKWDAHVWAHVFHQIYGQAFAWFYILSSTCTIERHPFHPLLSLLRYPRQKEIERPVCLHLFRVHSTCNQIRCNKAEVIDNREVVIHHRDGILAFIRHFAQLSGRSSLATSPATRTKYMGLARA